MPELPEVPRSVPIRLAVVSAELSNDVPATSLGKGRIEELRPHWSDLELVNHSSASFARPSAFLCHPLETGWKRILGTAKLRTVETDLQLMVEFPFPLAG
jgi:hypothetical protein